MTFCMCYVRYTRCSIEINFLLDRVNDFRRAVGTLLISVKDVARPYSRKKILLYVSRQISNVRTTGAPI